MPCFQRVSRKKSKSDHSVSLSIPPPSQTFWIFEGGDWEDFRKSETSSKKSAPAAGLHIQKEWFTCKKVKKFRRLRRASCGYVKFTNINLPIIVFGSKVFLNLKNNFFDIKGKLSLTLDQTKQISKKSRSIQRFRDWKFSIFQKSWNRKGGWIESDTEWWVLGGCHKENDF